MSGLIVTILIVAGLFATVYFTKRRFGILGLALCAGSLLSTTWAASLTPFLQGQGVVLVSPPLSAVVAVGLILLPPALLLFSGSTYNNVPTRLVGAAAFAVLALVFLLEPLAVMFVLDATSLNLFTTLSEWSEFMVVAGIGLAVADILAAKAPKPRRAGKAEH